MSQLDGGDKRIDCQTRVCFYYHHHHVLTHAAIDRTDTVHKIRQTDKTDKHIMHTESITVAR